MTLYATRTPLQLIENPHIMNDAQRNGRRHSSRLAEKEDALPNGLGNSYDSVKPTQKTGTSSRGGKAAVGAKSTNKRKPSYDEEDAGFAFTRTRAKKAKAEPMQPPIAEEAAPPKQPEPVPQKRAKKRPEDRTSTVVAKNDLEKSTRRSTRSSGGSPTEADPPPLAVTKKRKRVSDEANQASQEQQSHAPPNHPDEDHTHPVQISSDSTQIALPFADTPIIRRNQEMRRGAASGSRRSSLGMRGRRASSLIDTGKSNALPHDEVETTEFYKHIESEGLSEPRRMKQLLTWCGTRALGEKPSFSGKDRDAALAAREIQSQLLKDFSTKSSLSDWFSREDIPVPPSPPKPNPKNAANEAKIHKLEQQLAQLKTSREAYTSLLSPPSLPPLTSPSEPSHAQEQQSSLPLPLESERSTTTAPTRLNAITSSLEPRVDAFAANVHALSAYTDVAGRLADEALAECARVLDARQRLQNGEGDGKQGLRDVLRGLSRVVDR